MATASEMKTEILKEQKWAMTGSWACFGVRDGFRMEDVQAIDAPKAVPTGCTRENIVVGVEGMEDTRAVVGGITFVR